ncbi:MAG: D-sedoheptulose 7-phosphate isomerase [Phycisphaerae bacterium]|nr:D-sedoheptulose 7-phosphate isomerase [Phycisphaerae bacterium]
MRKAKAMEEGISARFEESIETTRRACEHLSGRIARAVEVIVDAYRAGGGVFLFGNGGSAADAQHIAGELVGRFLMNRRALKAQALTADSSVLTCLANDYNYEMIFARQLEANAGGADVAVALTTSGDSPNVIAGLKKARQIGMKTIAFTGKGGGKCAELADILLDVPSTSTPRVQEVHVVIYHILCELVERAVAGS